MGNTFNQVPECGLQPLGLVIEETKGKVASLADKSPDAAAARRILVGAAAVVVVHTQRLSAPIGGALAYPADASLCGQKDVVLLP